MKPEVYGSGTCFFLRGHEPLTEGGELCFTGIAALAAEPLPSLFSGVVERPTALRSFLPISRFRFGGTQREGRSIDLPLTLVIRSSSPMSEHWKSLLEHMRQRGSLTFFLAMATLSVFCQRDSTASRVSPCCDQSLIGQKFHFTLSVGRGKPEYAENSALYDWLMAYMTACSTTQLEVSYHAGPEYASESNRQLSLRTAQAIVNYLVSQGIPPERIVPIPWTPGLAVENRPSVYPAPVSHTSAEWWVEFKIASCE